MKKYAIKLSTTADAKMLYDWLPEPQKEFYAQDQFCSVPHNQYFLYPHARHRGDSKEMFSNGNHLISCNLINRTIISVSEFLKLMKIEDKKIIGYKVPCDISAISWSKGEIAIPWELKLGSYHIASKLNALPAGVVEMWEPVYEEDIVKKFTMTASNGDFELEVSKKGIYYRPDNSFLNPDFLWEFTNPNCKLPIEKAEALSGYMVRVTKVDVGCKKDTLVSEWKAVYDYYKSITNVVS